MADNDQNEEYEFSDEDIMNPDSTLPDYESNQMESSDAYHPSASNNVLRNALIAVAVVFIAMLLYRFIGAWYGDDKSKAEQAAIPSVKMADETKAQQVPDSQVSDEPAQVSQVPTTPEASDDSETSTQAGAIGTSPQDTPTAADTSRAVSALEIRQQSLSSDVSTLSGQISSINNNINQMSDQISKLNQMIEQLSSQLEQQSQEVARLRVIKVRKAKPVVIRPVRRQVVYSIRAIIPGRAWLIASNGTTISVREGSTISGYGVVKLIDPIQGKVLTSSGKIIRFSPLDS